MGGNVSVESFPIDMVHHIMDLGVNGDPSWTAMDVAAAGGVCRKLREYIFQYSKHICVAAPLSEMLRVDPFGRNNRLRQRSFGPDALYHPSTFALALVDFGQKFKKKFTVRVEIEPSTPSSAISHYNAKDIERVNERDLMLDFRLPPYDHFTVDIKARTWEDLYWTTQTIHSTRFCKHLETRLDNLHQLTPLILGSDIPFTINGDRKLLKIVSDGEHWQNYEAGAKKIEDRLCEYLELPWVFANNGLEGDFFVRHGHLRFQTAILYDGMMFPSVRGTSLGTFSWPCFWARANVRCVRFYILGVNIHGGANRELTPAETTACCPELFSGKYRMSIDPFKKMKMGDMVAALRAEMDAAKKCPLRRERFILEQIEFVAPKLQGERRKKFQYFKSLRCTPPVKRMSVAEEILEPSNRYHTMTESGRWEKKVFAPLEALAADGFKLKVIRPC